MEVERDNYDVVSALQNMSVAESSSASNWLSPGRSPSPEIDGSTSSPGRPQEEPNSTAYIPFRSAANDTSRYRRLDTTSKEIRCIVIHPCLKQGADAPLVCSLRYTSLNDANHIKYVALSYCWGDVSETVPITLIHRSEDTEAGADAAQQYQITRNLESALRGFRHERKSHVLWVDAICINQHDPVERSAQVSFMRQIYAASEQVVVWLGEGDGATRFLFGMARFYGKVKGPWEIQWSARRKASQHDSLRSDVQDRLSEPSDEEREHDNTGNETKKGGPLRPVGGKGVSRKNALEDLASTRGADHRNKEDSVDDTTRHTLTEEKKADEEDTEPGADLDQSCQLYLRQSTIRHMIRGDKDTWALMLSSVLSRPWFNRVWVIQEVFCGVPDGSKQRPKVPCTTKALLTAGSFHCSFDDFCRFIKEFGPTISANQATSRLVIPLTHFQTQWINHWKAFFLELGITELLAIYQGFQATDSRDKLFALLALSWDAGGRIKEPNDVLMQPDYCKTPTKVCMDFSRWQIGLKQDLQLFGCTKKSLAGNASSWAPDVLSSGTFELFFDVHESIPYAHMLATADTGGSTAGLDSTPGLDDSREADSGTSSTPPKITFEGSTLQVMGNAISRVDKILDAKVSAVRYTNSGAIRLLLECGASGQEQKVDLFVLLNAFTREFTDEPSDATRLQKALCMFTMCSRDDANYSYRPEEFQAYLDESATSDCMNDRVVPMSTAAPVKQADPEEKEDPFWDDAIMTKEEEKSRHPFWRRIMTQGDARCFFVTDTGELGLGPRYLPLHKDDLVVALDTAKFPHILRPCPEPELEGKFRLVGPCSFYDQQYMNHPKYKATPERPVRLFEIV